MIREMVRDLVSDLWTGGDTLDRALLIVVLAGTAVIVSMVCALAVYGLRSA